MRRLVLQLTRTERATRRQKTGILNIVGLAAHLLFGVLSSYSEAFYKRKIAQLEDRSWIGLFRFANRLLFGQH